MNKVFQYLDSEKDEIIEFTKELIRIPTVNPPGDNYEEIVALLEDKCRRLGFDTKRHITPRAKLKSLGIEGGSKRVSLVVDWDTGSKKTLHMNGHYDVVPPTSNWTFDPFKPVLRDGRIYGRGSEDMKGDIAAMIFSLKALKECNVNPPVNIQMSWTPDEEIGGESGLGYLVERGLVKGDYALGEGYSRNFVSHGNKGVLWLEVTIIGKSSHASRPDKGINAFEKMLKVAEELEKLKLRIEKRVTRYDIKSHREKSPTLVMGGVMKGGNKINIVPDIATFSIDRRIIPEESVKSARDEILKALNIIKKEDKEIKIIIKEFASCEPVVVDKEKKLCKAALRSIKKVSGKSAKLAIMPGVTDLRFFIERGVESIGYSAYGGECWHGDDEFVYVDSLIETAKVYAQIIMCLGG